MRRAFLTLAIALPFASLVGTQGADKPVGDWPQFRGPERDGISHETGLMKSWPTEGPPLLWRAEGLGQGYSSVSIADGRIFVMGDRTNGAHLMALNLADGKELWATRIGASFSNNQGGGPRGTPTVDGDRVYGVSGNGDLACVEIASGKLLWSKSFTRDFGGRMQRGWGYSESPLVDGDKLVCTPGGRDATLVALNKHTGDVLWKARTPAGDASAYCSMVVANGGGIRQYVQLVEGGLIGVAADDGRFLWKYEKIANRTANIPTPIVKGDLVFTSTGYQTGAALLRLVKDGGGVKAQEVYFLNSRELQNHHGGMILVGEHVFCGHGHNAGSPICIDLKTGKARWRQDRGPGSGSAAVAYADGHLYFRYQNGVMALIEANPSRYVLKSRFTLPHQSDRPSWPHPVIHDGKLYVRDQDNLLCFDVRART